MGKKEFIKIFKLEKEINENKFLSPKEVKKALKNLGHFYRDEYIWKEIKNLRDKKILEIENDNKIRKKYRLCKSYEKIY